MLIIEKPMVLMEWTDMGRSSVAGLCDHSCSY